MSAASFNKIETAHQMYREGRYDEALGYYTEALAVAKTKPQKIALHSNRAACYLKLHHFRKAADECTAVLELDHNHTGALMLRAQTLVTLKEYNSALFDVNQLLELDPSSEVYHNLQARLRTQVALAPIPESEAELEEEEEEHEEPYTGEKEVREDDKKEDIVVPAVGKDINAAELNEYPVKAKMIASAKSEVKEYADREMVNKNMPQRNPGVTALREQNDKDSKGCQVIPKSQGYSGQKNVPQSVAVAAPREQSIKDSKGWQAIPKPKGHTALDYARWDRVENDSSDDDDDDDDDEDSQPQYRFRVRTVGIRSVK
ncbi:hypothetical protein like AT1G56090 [Hibiscus trionum]|uniref:Uncharacterized protein n=1 Tax=Hibiscus trionum TaxID=183268 RepID=A0A9W7MV34_HIBTR|nr:hypothetical protein like AT1G56090 [Hibiscus trionum]